MFNVASAIASLPLFEFLHVEIEKNFKVYTEQSAVMVTTVAAAAVSACNNNNKRQQNVYTYLLYCYMKTKRKCIEYKA